jgi:hypothetical protein
MTQSVYMDLTANAPGAPNGPNGAVIKTMFGLDDYDIWILTATLRGVTGGTLDLWLQSADIPRNTVPANFAGPWWDVAHFPQLAAAAPVARYRAMFNRGYGTPASPQLINATDLPPTLAVNTINPWNIGNALRVVALTGAGVTAGSQQILTLRLSL